MPLYVKKYRFTAKWYLTLLTLCFIALFITLGCWQLERGREKAALETSYEARLKQAPIPFAQVLPRLKNINELNYSPMTVTGEYDNAHTMLLDNKIYQHQVGYSILTPFVPTEGYTTLLVNRGWIAAGENRQILPNVPAVTGKQQLTGYIYITQGKSFTLGSLSETDIWPLRIQALDIPTIGQLLQKPLYPFVLLLTTDTQVNGPVRDWQLAVTPAAKHRGYAVQWFTFALVLLIIFLALSVRKI